LAPLVIYKATEATALNSKSTRLNLGHLNTVENVELFAFLSAEFRKYVRTSLKNKERALLRNSTGKMPKF